MLWCLLAIWDFCSQILFAAFLVLQITNNVFVDELEIEILLILFIIVCVFLCISYLCNLLYLIHYLQIWNDPSAPGVTRHWLELWSWLIIFITMTMGGVHVALELCNSIIIPIDVFSMHLSHSEIVRTRKDRFITNVLIQDLPILLILLIYIFLFHQNEFLNGELFTNIKYIVIINVLLCTLISVLITSFFRFLRRNYSHDNPVAQYQFSFTLKTSDGSWQSYWIHSHQKIQKCFKVAFALRKLSLTIIDQCSESLNSMKIEGRLLRDEKWKSQRVERMATRDVTHDEMRDIGLDLLKQFKKEFNLLYADDIRIDHLTIKPIPGGEIVYNHRTCVQILCVGLKDCCHSIWHRLCPSFVEPPPPRRQSTAVIAATSATTTKLSSSPRHINPALSVDSVVATQEQKLYKQQKIAISDSSPQPPPVSKEMLQNIYSNSIMSGEKKTISPKMMKLSVERSTESIQSISKSNNTSASNNHLPMITISSKMENLRDSIDETDPNQIIKKHINGQSYDFSGQNPGYIDKRENDRKASQYKSPQPHKNNGDNHNNADKEPSQSASARLMKLDQQTLFADVYNNNNNQNEKNALKEDEENTPPPNPPSINPQEWYAQMYNDIKNKERKNTDQYGYESSRKIKFKTADEKVKEIAGDAPVAFSVSKNNLLNNIDDNDNANIYNAQQYQHNDDDDDDDEVDI